MQLSNDTTTRTLQLIEAIARELGILVDPEPHMPTVTKSIGTTGRDYSTITLWEADLDNTGIYASGDTAVGECYNDSAFSEDVSINGGSTVGLARATLSVAAGQRHTGVAGSGARVVGSAKCVGTITPTTIEWLEVNKNGNYGVGSGSSSGTWTTNQKFHHLIVHGVALAAGTANCIGLGVTGYPTDCWANLIYGISNEANGYALGLGGTGSAGSTIQNNTVHSVAKNNGTETSKGFDLSDSTGSLLKNNIATDVGGTTSGSKTCFPTLSSATNDHNLSSDATAAGTGSLTNKTSANQFVSTTVGSEDLHLKAGADAIDAGATLSTPTGITEDIDGVARSGTWDIGADEYVASSSFLAKSYSVLTAVQDSYSWCFLVGYFGLLT